MIAQSLAVSSVGMFLFFLAIMSLFFYQTFKKKYHIPYLLSGVTVGVLGTLVNLVFVLVGAPMHEMNRIIFTACLSTVAVAFFLFFESIDSLRPRFGRTVPVLFCFTAVQVMNALRFLPVLTPELDALFDRVTMVAYSLLGLLIYGGIGIPYYVRGYRLTRERINLLLATAMVVGVATYGLIFTNHAFIPRDAPYLDTIVSATGILSSAFIAIFALTYLFNLDYIYRLPFDNYILMVAYRTGIPIQKIELESSKDPVIKDALVTGLLSAVNNLFMEALDASTDIENISSQDATVIVKTGRYATAIVIGERATAKLADATGRFLAAFEARYADELAQGESEMSLFDNCTDLVPPFFPFFKIKGASKSKDARTQVQG